jgi:chlorobactene glucosyltransferase
MIQTTILVISSLALLIGAWVTWWVHSRHALPVVVAPDERPGGSPETWPLVSVVVPARNEARNIKRCVQSLLVQNYPRLEVIVVDDRSTDATPEILAELVERAAAGSVPLRVLVGAELPPGWAGKPHALVQGVAAASGDWLCFMDADTFAGPDLLTSTLAAAQRQQADLFTILTEQELGSFWERVVLPLVFTALSFGFPAQQVNDPKRPEAIANGQFILVRRAVYARLGGHAAVRERIDEDKALAELVKRSGYRLIVADGRRVVRTRMYTSLAEIWEGWTKNIYLGLRDRLWLLLLGATLGLLGALALPLWLLGGLGWWALGGGLPATIVVLQAAILWAELIWFRMRAAQAFGISAIYAWTLPLGALIFTGMMFASAFKVLSKRGVSWKGRTYVR